MQRLQVRWACAVLRHLVRLLPARSRNRYGQELQEAYAALLADAARNDGGLRLLHRSILLLADCMKSLAAEYLDLWRASRLNPHFAGAVLLFVSIITWLLVLLASAAGQAWAADLLDASLALTMVMAFGFPALALALSRIRLVPYVRTTDAAQLGCTAGATSVATWAILALHLGQTAS